ncbi:MAG: YbeD family protein [Bradymonadaceae bacterium]
MSEEDISDREASIETLKQTHSFPCDYEFKAIGPNSAAFVAEVIQVGVDVLGRTAHPQIRTRESSEGKYVSVSMSLEMASPEAILDVYALIRSVEDVRVIL